MFGFLSNDPFIYVFRTFNYNIIKLLRANVKPLHFLVKNGKDLQRAGELETVFKAGENIPMPKIQNDFAHLKPIESEVLLSGESKKRAVKPVSEITFRQTGRC